MYEAVEGNNPIRDTIGEENYDLLKYGSATVISFGGAILETGMSMSVCFIAGTEVLSESGHRLIENIEAGDYVWATNPETGETDLKKVVQTFENEATELVHITVNGEEIVCTNEHPFYVPVKGWTAACQLRAGDCLQLVNGEYVIVEQVQHEILESPIKVYNFEVEDFHTYYVGNSDILVHNSCGDTANVSLPQDKQGLNHIFNTEKGHISDTPTNRALLIDTVAPNNFLGLDSYGNSWYGKILNDGRQVWVEVRNGLLWDGGINNIVRSWNPTTGLKKNLKG